MKAMSFESLGYTWERITRTEARKRYDRGEDLMLCPSNLRPGWPFNPEVYTYRSEDEPRTFEEVENTFRYYNLYPGAGNRVMYFKNASRDAARRARV